MKSIAAIIEGGKNLRQAFGLWGILYGGLLLLALFFAMPIHSLLENMFGHSLELQGKPGTFDYTLVADLLNNEGSAFAVIFAQAKWIILIFLILTIFLRSGTVAHFFKQRTAFQFSTFIEDCTTYFWRFFRANIYFLLIHAAWLTVAIFLFQSITGGSSPFEIDNDGDLIKAYYITVPLYLCVVLLLLIGSDLTKFEIILQDKSIITNAILEAFKKLFKHILPLLFFYLLLGLLFFCSYKLFQVLENLISPQSGIGVWLLLILGQIFVLLRIGLSLLKYAGLDVLRRNYEQSISQ